LQSVLRECGKVKKKDFPNKSGKLTILKGKPRPAQSAMQSASRAREPAQKAGCCAGRPAPILAP
jgi:hypothetical protein